MFSVVSLEDSVKLKPEQLGFTKHKEHIVKLFEGKILGRINSYIIKIIDIDTTSIKDGLVNDIDGSTNYNVKYTAVIFEPVLNQVLNVIVKECNNNTIWFNLLMIPDVSLIECICTKKYIPEKYKFNDDLCIWSSETNDIIGIGTELKLEILNFQIDSNKIMIFGSLMI